MISTNKIGAANDSIFTYLKDTLSIEEVATHLEELNLTEQSGELVGQCPTGHPSKSGKSFHIVPEKQFYYCFNCGNSGDIVELVKTTKNISRREAVNWLLKEFNLTHLKHLYPDWKKSEREEKKEAEENLKHLLFEEVYQLGKELLFQEERKEVLNYLTQVRGYDEEVLKDTEFIYLPEEKKVKELLHQRKPELKDYLHTLKLNGFFGDNFRLAFPYRNRFGKITGFLKRSVKPEGQTITTYDGKEHNNVRWDSTPGTVKNDIFGLHRLKDTNTVLIVEGYPDAVYLSASGYKNIVAVGQANLSKNHLIGLKRKGIENIIICFDNDNTGTKNTKKAINTLLEDGAFNAYVLDPKELDPHKDPDEYVKANGLDKFKELTSRVVRESKWMLNSILRGYDTVGEMGQDEMIQNAFNLGTKLPLSSQKEHFIEEFSKLTGLSSKAIRKDLEQKLRKEKSTIKKNVGSMAELNLNDRYFPFIERQTSDYAYFDFKDQTVYMGVKKEILIKILEYEGQTLPENPCILKATFNPKCFKKIDLNNELYNFFTPTEYMYYEKNDKTIKPEEDFPKINLLLQNLIPREKEREHFLNWLAGILQTRCKQATSWIFKGEIGAGKNLFFQEVLKELLGDDQAIEADNEMLNTEFNGYLQNVLLVEFNEIATNNTERNKIKSKLKKIITDPETFINEKNVKRYRIENYVNAIFFSNEFVPVVIESNDRRYSVIKTRGNLMNLSWFNKNPDENIEEMNAEVPNFAQYLINLNYNPNKARKVIDNQEKRELVGAAMDRYEEFAMKLKERDIEWFNENQTQSKEFLGFEPHILSTEDLENNCLEKTKALTIFKNIYQDQKITTNTLSKKLLQHQIDIAKKRKNQNGPRRPVYIWE